VRVCILRKVHIKHHFLPHIFVEQVFLSEDETWYETRNCLSFDLNFLILFFHIRVEQVYLSEDATW
jgi:hypothetical protein